MGRFLFWTVVFTILGGLALHYHEMLPPYLYDWVGKLPGDLRVDKDGIIVHFPIVTAALLGMVFSLVTSSFKK